VEIYEALKTLFNSGDVLGKVSDAMKHSYIDRIDRMEAQYQKAGASGSFNADHASACMMISYPLSTTTFACCPAFKPCIFHSWYLLYPVVSTQCTLMAMIRNEKSGHDCYFTDNNEAQNRCSLS